MSLEKSLYARYYNATRHGGRRRGALWAERFSAEVYYDAAVAYVLLNPVRVKEPMVESPEIYPWSSCAMTAVRDYLDERMCGSASEAIAGLADRVESKLLERT